jgi:hypothetical protein
VNAVLVARIIIKCIPGNLDDLPSIPYRMWSRLFHPLAQALVDNQIEPCCDQPLCGLSGYSEAEWTTLIDAYDTMALA